LIRGDCFAIGGTVAALE